MKAVLKSSQVLLEIDEEDLEEKKEQLQQNSNAARPAETGGVVSEIVSAQLEY